MKILQNNNRTGFTLLELLVTISIIGILIALATVSFTTAQKNGRDSRRRADMEGIKNALEQYYAINTQYPISCANPADLIEVLPSGIPSDPRGTAPYTYTLTCTGASYCACALLEQEGRGNSNDASCNMASGGDYYCVQSLQ